MIFKAEDLFYIKGHGFVFSGRLEEDIEYGFKGDVTITGVGRGDTFTVVAVECFGIARPDNLIKIGESVGFLVGRA